MKQFMMKHGAVLVSMVIFVILLLLPTGYEGLTLYQDRETCKAVVLEVNNENISTIGIVSTGDQTCTVQIQGGQFDGQTAKAYNMLAGSSETDKIFAVGDVAQVLVSHDGGNLLQVSMVDHYRLDVETILLIAFFVFLIAVAGKTGIRSILSFMITILTIWKILIPGCLNGMQPVVIGLIITAFLTIVIISLVFGFDRRTLAASAGSLTGTLVTMILALLFTDLFSMNGSI